MNKLLARALTSFEHNPVRYLTAFAGAVAFVERYVHNPSALAALGFLFAGAEYVRAQVTPEAHIAKPDAAQFLDMAIEANVPTHVESDPNDLLGHPPTP